MNQKYFADGHIGCTFATFHRRTILVFSIKRFEIFREL